MTPKWEETQPLFDDTTAFEGPDVSGSVDPNQNQKSQLPKTLANSKVLPIAGGVAGGLMGGIPGAALGGAGGEAYRQLLARGIGEKAPETSGEAASEIGVEGLTQAGAEIGGRVLKPVVKGAANLVKKPLGQLFQIITKIKPQYAETLFNNPKAILPGQMNKAKEAWRMAAQEAGIPIDDVSPEIINALKKDARTTVFDTFEKIRNGEAVNASEAQVAKQALDIALMPAAKTERNAPMMALFGKMRQQFSEVIGRESPELAAANKQYAVAKAGDKFKSLFPRNLDDSPAYFRSASLPVLGSIAGANEDKSLSGAVKGAAKGAALSALVSPAAFGSLIAGTGALRPAGRVAGKITAASLAELLESLRDE